MITRYSVYTNSELLLVLHDKRSHSPIIEELCQRLEASEAQLLYAEPIPNVESQHCKCPICESEFTK